MPEVVRSEEAAVGVRVSESTPMTVSAEPVKVKSSDELEVEIVETVEDRSGPIPLERLIAEAVAEEVSVSVPEMDVLDTAPGTEARVVRAVETPLIVGNDPVSVDVAPAAGAVDVVDAVDSDVALAPTPGVEPAMMPGVESGVTPGVGLPTTADPTAEVDDVRDSSGCLSSVSKPNMRAMPLTERGDRIAPGQSHTV